MILTSEEFAQHFSVVTTMFFSTTLDQVVAVESRRGRMRVRPRNSGLDTLESVCVHVVYMCFCVCVHTGFEPVRWQNIFSGVLPLFAFSATV